MINRRLIEVAFPLEQASLDSVHEKNVRHGHISTLHIWPARRPLAACRAALIATLLPDPGTPEKRRELCERIGGKIDKVIEKRKGPGNRGEEKIVRKTIGGILHWGREAENKADLDFFCQEIRKAFGGRAPRVLDPFAGGGAIPLEAMRLGCEATAIDINPVAWFILKCTLEYPQKLAGQRRPLPDFVRSDAAFMESFFKAQGFKGAMLRSQLRKLGLSDSKKNGAQQHSLKDTQTGKDVDLSIEEHTLEADLAWHVRAWGWWVLREARGELAHYYPAYADFQPMKDVDAWRRRHPEQARPMQLVPTFDDGTPDIDSLNADLSGDYLADGRTARWVAKPAVAYLWARTAKCKNCRATIPLLKTCWLVKKDAKRALLRMQPNADKSGVQFAIACDVPVAGGNNAQRRENDRRLGQGTMSRAGAWCPCCGKSGTVAMEGQDIRAEAMAGRMGVMLTAVVVEGQNGKEYRLPTDLELSLATPSEESLHEVFHGVPFGEPEEPTPAGGGSGAGRAFAVHGYGLKHWKDLFTARQMMTLGTFVGCSRHVRESAAASYPTVWTEAISAYLALAVDRVANRCSMNCIWNMPAEKIEQTFARFALPVLWDFAESCPLGDASGGYWGEVEWVSAVCEHVLDATRGAPPSTVLGQSAINPGGHYGSEGGFDVVVTDPPYYDAIPYSDLMDFFYIWLRRTVWNLSSDIDSTFQYSLTPKWNHELGDGELIDDPSRHQNNAERSRQVYEDGMAQVFTICRKSLAPNGRMVIVFASKQPAAWETLVSSIIRAGFAVDGSWPIQTERSGRMRATGSAALASSIWLTCRKRPDNAKPGWDNLVLAEMRQSISENLREFWKADIKGPNFIWAATGPALEAYSNHPIVKKANDPGETMSVAEFLRTVRRMVVEFVVGSVLGELTHQPMPESIGSVSGLDDVTTYYLLHRHDFGMNDAPAGACILYALSCNLSEGDLADRYAILLRSGGVDQGDDGEPVEGDADAEGDVTEGSGSTFKLRPWKQRRRAGLGMATVNRSVTVPLVDMAHHLMHLWIDGDVHKVNAYIDERGLRRSDTFRHVLQALIELAKESSDERSVLERISNHLQARGQAPASLRDVGLGVAAVDEQE